MNQLLEVVAVLLALALPIGLVVAAVFQRQRHAELAREVARLSGEVRRLSLQPAAAPPAPASQAPATPAPAASVAASPPPGPVLPTELPPPLPPMTGWAPPPAPARPAPTARIDWESLVGVRLFSWIAGVALLVAAVSFLRWSIESGWLGPPVRAAIGALVGVGLLVGAETRWARRYAVTAQSLAAAGVAILFATVFAAHALWDLLPALAAFPLLVLVAAVAMAYSVRRASLTMALLGLAGGFATPILLSTGEDRPIGLFSYLLLLNAGLAWVAQKRRWPLLGVVALGLTALYQLGWVLRFLGEANLLVGAVVFLVFPAFAFFTRSRARRGAAAGQAPGDPLGQVAGWTAALSAVPSALFLFHAAASPELAARWPLVLGFAVLLCAGLLVVAALQGPEWLHLVGAGAAVSAFALLAWSRHLPGQAWPWVLLPMLALGAVVLGGPLLLERWGRTLRAEGAFGAFAAPAVVALSLMALGPPGDGDPGDELIRLAALLLLSGGTAAVAARGRHGPLLATAAAACIYTAPYKPFIPLEGIEADLSFTGDPGTVDVCNQALIHYRRDLQDFMTLYASIAGVDGPPAQLHQWPLNIET